MVYLDGIGIMHRDINFENILFVDQNSYNIKIIGFSLAKIFTENPNEITGSLGYMAPEIF